MKRQNPGTVTRYFHSGGSELFYRIFRNRIKLWQRCFTAVLILSFILISPLGSMPAYALGVPDLIAPIDESLITVDDVPPLGIPEFEWAAIPGATSYRLQVSSDIAFTTIIVNITTPNTTYTPTNASVFADGTWHWRVRVEAPTPVGDYSGIWRFTKQWATEGNKPTLSDPLGSAEIDFYDSPVFSWSPVLGAAKYKLQIYASSGGWSNLTYTATTLTTTHQPITKLSNGTYYWRVVPIDPGGHEGTPSDEWSFNESYNLVPSLVEPKDLANPVFTPTFRWTAVRGAQYYRLQYTTDPFFSSGITQIDTRNVAYTPTSTMPNDVNYYWRVRVISGNSISNWTEVQSFIKKWYIKPVLLTPTNNYQHQRFPFFSWTPVPGASYYKIEISPNPGFSPLASYNTSNTFFTSTNTGTTYWRVTPYDGNGKAGVASNTSSYASYSTSVAPLQVYPLYYYTPDIYPSPFSEITTNPHEDRTVSLPIFIWHRVFTADQGNVYADAYRLQVSTDPTFSLVDWTIDTENLVAAPSTEHPFTPLPNIDYFWRVRPLNSGIEDGQWSQVWKTRIDLTKGLTPTTGAIPTLLRPTEGFEFAETTPLLEWFPIDGATSYDVQISNDSNFSTTVDTATVSYPAYAPSQSLAQRSLGSVDFEIFYWRVRKPGGSWSETRRFQIAAQSQWQSTRTLGAAANQLQIGSDAASDISDADYDLTDLQVAQSSNYWYFGFHVPGTPTKNVTYTLYLDLDHQEASGATFDARGHSVTTIPGYQPEYAIYVFQEAGVFSAAKVYLYHWNGSDWDIVNVLNNIGGQINLNSGYIELEVPNTAIGYQDSTGSYAISLFSLPAAAPGIPQDSVPSDPNIPVTGEITRFANVTERMNLSMPPNNAGVDSTTYPSILPFFWDWPVLSPWSGANIKAYLDEQFTTEVAAYSFNSILTSHAWEEDFIGDNTYFWRIQPKYGGISGAWSQAWRFERKGFIPDFEKLKISVDFATPTFSWDKVEGAESYNLQVDNDPGFGSPEIDINTRQNSYTHTSTLANATYNWRVRVRRNGSPTVINNWTFSKTFPLDLDKPEGLTYEPSEIVDPAPTLCWTPLINPTDVPVLAAWKYRVQVSKEPTFSSIFDTIDTEQSCWTPIKGYDDGDYYWRVAMIDGNGKLGSYRTYENPDPDEGDYITKQYPITTLISPVSGSTVTSTPTFIWAPVQGAAKYKLEVSLYSNFSSTVDSITTNNTRYTPTKAYAVKGTYYWRVAILDADGKIGPFNDATIIVDPYPGAFRKITPVNGTFNQPANPTLTWEPSSRAASYEYCIDTSNDNACAASWVSTGAETSITLSSLVPAMYYWQVRAKNAAGYTYANTETWWSFSTIPVITKYFTSIGTRDGWVLESSETSTIGGSMNATAVTFSLGDNIAKKQYRGILSFNTGAVLPDNAVITSVKIKITKSGVVGGGNPVSTFQGFMVDVKKGFFSTSADLQVNDFQAARSKTLGPFTPTPVSNVHTINLTNAKDYINKLSTASGVTQIRLRFKLDDNNDAKANYIKFFSGNNATSKPQLIITYYVP